MERLGARLCLSGHGRPFGDVQGSHRRQPRRGANRLEETEQAIAERPLTAFEVAEAIMGEVDPRMMGWVLTIVLCFLTHLEREGRAERVRPSDSQQPERWRALAPTAARP